MRYPRDEPFKNLQYAVNHRAIVDLARNCHYDSAETIVTYLLTHYIDNEYSMQTIIRLALQRRFLKMLQQIDKELDRMEGKIQHMRMTLDDLFKDMEETARHVEQLNKEPVNEADKIEEALEEDDADDNADEDENDNADEDENDNNNLEEKTED